MRVRVEFGYLLALGLTLVLVFWQNVGMNRTLTLDIGGDSNAESLGDSINGGRSQMRVSTNDDGVSLDCTIVSSGTFPFCSMVLYLTDRATKGIDLSRYDTLELDLSYRSSERDTLLVYLQNREQADGVAYERANMVTLIPSIGDAHYQIDLQRFHVPSWWVFSRNGASNSEVDLSNVTKLQISSGDNYQPRSLGIRVTGVYFHGKWIRAERLFQLILIGWLMIGVLHLLFSAYRLNKKQQRSRQQARELTHLNTFLQTERDKYEQLAKVDPLTGCLNRYGLRELLERLLMQQDGSKKGDALILLDLDYFKKINDLYGHDEGDAVLKKLVALIQQHIRDSDTLVRWGGEEFAIVCEHTSLEGAIGFADNLRKLVERTELTTYVPVTASFGVAVLEAARVDNAFKEADEQLYAAKKSGRNCVQPALKN